jgi:hypothetical protein
MRQKLILLLRTKLGLYEVMPGNLLRTQKSYCFLCVTNIFASNRICTCQTKSHRIADTFRNAVKIEVPREGMEYYVSMQTDCIQYAEVN